MTVAPALVFLLLLACSLPQKSRSQCVELIDGNCARRISEPDECACLFNRNISASSCTLVADSLGLNCSSHDGPAAYVANLNNNTEEDRVHMNETLCVLDRVCQCLSREAEHDALLEVEETCRRACLSAGGNSTQSLTGGLDKNSKMCRIVHSHYCRRNDKDQRSQECAAYCVQEDQCVSLIEGILENDFVGNDMDAAISMMVELQGNAVHAQPVDKLLKYYSIFYDAFERDENTVISYFNDTNSEVLMSLFNDLFSNDRQMEWMQLQQGDEIPGQTILEMLERTSYLLGRSHQLRVQLQPFVYEGTNMDMSVACQVPSSAGYTQVFNIGVQEAVLHVKEKSGSFTSNCSMVISAVLSSNLGCLLLSTSSVNTTQVNTNVMTVQAVGAIQFTDIRVILPAINASTNFYNATCVFWNITDSQWSTEGVELVAENESHYTCQSTHLTSFAVLVSINPLPAITVAEAVALSVVTYIGCSISILCLLLTLFWMVLLRKLLQKGVLLYIHFNLFLALLLALILFVSGLETAVHIEWLCTTVAALLHYLFLCVFCWMLAEGIVLYVLVVRAFATNFKRWYYLLPLGWGLPIPIVAVSVGLRHEFYGTSTFCWLSVQNGVIWSFVGPILAVILVNSVILILTVVNVVRVKRRASTDAGLSNLRLIMSSVKSAVVLLPLLGITWILGLFSVDQNTTVFVWIFTVLNSLQGALIFLLHILRNKNVRRWMLRRIGLDRFLENITWIKVLSSRPHSTLVVKGDDILPMSGTSSSTPTIKHRTET